MPFTVGFRASRGIHRSFTTPVRRLVTLTAVATALIGAAPALGVANATPSVPTIERVESEGPTQYGVYVYAPSMAKTIKVQVLVPAVDRGPRPTLTMLSGLGEEDPTNSMWLRKTDAATFFRDKNVTVALPLAGNGSFYTDWYRDDPKLGRYKWETFLTKELPPLLEERFSGNGIRGIGGLSMGAGSALMLAARKPGFFRSVSSFSGCYSTADLASQSVPRAIVAAFGGNADNMWGPPSDPAWAAHDVLLHAEGLRGTTVYVSVGSGLPGPYEAPNYPGNTNPADRLIVGGGIEAGANFCTHRLADTLAARRIPATFDFEPRGSHSWPYWQDQLHRSWPTVARGLGIAR
ncbi:alpha/beta hydrolase family protein [uncultured Williamsia sp.]|uniref:alpha/beta hydrolase n=1 Tax=uncultured Williamsia sp. TaxID=259311 RepID=UPI002621E8EC|nr:alpha/beta hydrolase family protein [uncultured Williamsia sp.]